MAPRRTRVRRGGVVPVGPERFVGGWRLVGDAFPGFDPRRPPATPAAPDPTIVVDVVRGRDLVSLTAEFYGCELFSDDAGPVVRPMADAAPALMLIRFPYQHLGERAIYETPSPRPDQMDPNASPIPPAAAEVDPPNAWPTAPIDARPAQGSRLVFTLAAEDVVGFSTDGILAAMGRLPMAVHALATPKPTGRAILEGPVLTLPGGLSAALGADRVVVAPATATAVKRT
ncbi:MAG: hypothetical protein ABW195_19715, partial [Ilumatobacteraceae bacterium]